MSLKLYERTDCPFCWKVRIALAEVGLRYEAYGSKLGEPQPEVLRLSPKKTVPVLLDGDFAIWESGAILEYLGGLCADSTLFPKDLKACAKVRLLHQYSDTVVGPALRGLVFERRSKPETDWDVDIIRQSEKSWGNCLEWLQGKLAGKTYFAGEFSAADCALAARFGVAEAYGAGVDDRFPALLQWFDRIKQRRSWGNPTPHLLYNAMELSQNTGPVTMSIARTVVAGRENDYEVWLKGITADAVKYPGHMGVNVLKPTASSNEYVAIFRFDSYEHLKAWQKSPERESWLSSLEGLVEGEDRVQKSMGMEYWFSLPELPDAHPSPHKMALVLFVVVMCLVLLLNLSLYPYMAAWPLLGRVTITVLFQVLLMTYVVMPGVTRILKPWLYGK